MTAPRASFELFALPDIAGTPQQLAPASFSALHALELQHIERWIRERPLLVGEDLKIVTHQFAAFEGAKDRLDVLALDRAGRLVVIEVKRDTSGAYQDLQALRYAAFASTFRADQLAQAHADYLAAAGRHVDDAAARVELEAFIEGEDLDVVDEDLRPRIVLVAAHFQPAVMATVLWLRRAYLLDITCVQLVPYEIDGKLLVGSSILLPLPEADGYEIKVADKLHAADTRRETKLDHEKARDFIASIPEGRWSAYVDVAIAGGAPKGAMGVGAWLAGKSSGIVPNVYRVLNAKGEVAAGFRTENPDVPPDPDSVRKRLGEEGVRFDAECRADPQLRWTAEESGPALAGS